jgi:hypothetical protein
MASIAWASHEHDGHRFWTARHGRYSLRIDANKPGVYRWSIQDVTDDNRRVAWGLTPDRGTAARAVSAALARLA